MDRLQAYSLFVKIVEKKGLAAAGRELGLSPATVTERLRALEQDLGAQLLNRTTRSISLTDEGRVLFEGARKLLSEAKDLNARIQYGAAQLSGPIRLSAPLDLGRNKITPLVDRFMTENPSVEIELVLTDGFLDLVAQGIDFAIRLGDLRDSSLKAKKLGENRRLACAAPNYLQRFGTPKSPDDLHNHNCILMRFGPFVDHEWHFQVKGAPLSVAVRGNRIANDGELVRRWCVDGHGITLKSIWDVEDDLAAGRLREVLAQFAPAPTAIQIVYPGGQAMTRRVRALIEYLAEWFAHNQPRLR